jgi:hypothetical protein
MSCCGPDGKSLDNAAEECKLPVTVQPEHQSIIDKERMRLQTDTKTWALLREQVSWTPRHLRSNTRLPGSPQRVPTTITSHHDAPMKMQEVKGSAAERRHEHTSKTTTDIPTQTVTTSRERDASSVRLKKLTSRQQGDVENHCQVSATPQMASQITSQRSLPLRNEDQKRQQASMGDSSFRKKCEDSGIVLIHPGRRRRRIRLVRRSQQLKTTNRRQQRWRASKRPQRTGFTLQPPGGASDSAVSYFTLPALYFSTIWKNDTRRWDR